MLFTYQTSHAQCSSQTRLHIYNVFHRSDFTYTVLFTDQTSHTQFSSQIRLHIQNILHKLDFIDFTDSVCVSDETKTLSVQRFKRGAVTAVLDPVKGLKHQLTIMQRERSLGDRSAENSLGYRLENGCSCKSSLPHQCQYQRVFCCCCFLFFCCCCCCFFTSIK